MFSHICRAPFDGRPILPIAGLRSDKVAMIERELIGAIADRPDSRSRRGSQSKECQEPPPGRGHRNRIAKLIVGVLPCSSHTRSVCRTSDSIPVTISEHQNTTSSPTRGLRGPPDSYSTFRPARRRYASLPPSGARLCASLLGTFVVSPCHMTTEHPGPSRTQDGAPHLTASLFRGAQG